MVEMKDGKLGPRFPTPYAVFDRLRSEAAVTAAPLVQPTARLAEQPKSPFVPTARKLTWSEKRELEKLESSVEQLELTKSQLADEMNRCGDDYVRLQSLATELEQVDQRLEAATARWYELAEIAEAMQ